MNWKSHDELKQIARDVLAGRIYSDKDVPDPSMIHLVFVPLVFLSLRQVMAMRRQTETGTMFMLYEYVDKAGPRTVNGQPVFFSFRVLNRWEVEYIADLMKKMLDAYSKI